MSASSDSEWECDPLFENAGPELGPSAVPKLPCKDVCVTYNLGPHSIILVLPEAEDCGNGALGTRLWRGALVLVQALLADVVSLQGKRVLEIGAGVGLTGLLASKLGPRQIVMTDCSYESLLRLLLSVLKNLDHERAAGPACWGADCDQICIQRHLWENDLPRSAGRPLPQHWSNVCSAAALGPEGAPPDLSAESFFDVVIGSDVLYFEQQVEPLLSTVYARLNSGGHALLTVTVRRRSVYEHFLAGVQHAGLTLESEVVGSPEGDLDWSHLLGPGESTMCETRNAQEVRLVHLTKP